MISIINSKSIFLAYLLSLIAPSAAKIITLHDDTKRWNQEQDASLPFFLNGARPVLVGGSAPKDAKENHDDAYGYGYYDDDDYYYDTCAPYPFQLEPDWWFNYTSFQSAINCSLNSTTTKITDSCDYSDSIDIFMASCERVGGIFYSISGAMICPAWSPPYSWEVNELAYCLKPDCNIQDLMDQGYFAYEGCYNEIDSIITYEPIIDDTCKDEMSSFTEEAGGGDSQFAWRKLLNNFTFFETYCNVDYYATPLKVTCDVAELTAQVQIPCEEQGGLLYSFSDGFEWADIQDVSILNQPVCLGSSCEAQTYFEEYVFSFVAVDRNIFFGSGGNLTYKSTSGYKAISLTNCIVPFPEWLGDNWCDGGVYNTPECQYDGGDCLDFNAKYPDCDVTRPYWIGDGVCNGARFGYNTSDCGWDGGDCWTNTTANTTITDIGTRSRSLIEGLLDYMYAKPEDEILDWQK